MNRAESRVYWIYIPYSFVHASDLHGFPETDQRDEHSDHDLAQPASLRGPTKKGEKKKGVSTQPHDGIQAACFVVLGNV